MAFLSPISVTTQFSSSPLKVRNHAIPLPQHSRSFKTPVMKSATLPNDLSPAEKASRAKELEENQAIYIYESPPTIPKIAFIKGPVENLPGESPSRCWLVTVALVAANTVLNFADFSPGAIFNATRVFLNGLFTDNTSKSSIDGVVDDFKKAADAQGSAQKILKNPMLERFARASEGSSTFEENNLILQPYRDIFKTIDLPEIADVFMEDVIFCRLRTAGYNPLTLFGVTSLENLPFEVTDADMPVAGDTLAKAIEENRLYAQDFSFLNDIVQQKNSSKLGIPCKSMFVVPPGGGELLSVAIQIDGEQIVTPKSDDESANTRWGIAKLIVNTADAIHHEIIAHLGRTHLLIEPFVAATRRQLPKEHPLYVLLEPHFEGTVFINDSASTGLIAPGGDVDIIFAGEIESVMQLCGEDVSNNPFNSTLPDVEMKARNVMDPILNFPYREDALNHFEALHTWVYEYLEYFYKSDDVLRADQELKKWVEELVDPVRGRVKEFGDNGDGKVLSIKYLARAVAFIIFSSSVQHAAVNFPQLILMSYAPAVSGAVWHPFPAEDEKSSMKLWQQSLAPLDIASQQLQILSIIGAVYYTKLGQYRRRALPSDRPIKDALKKYQARLQEIDQIIAKREANETLKYEYMRPGLVPQSINI